MFIKLAAALLKPINTAAIILLGLYTTAWGLWVANPFWSVFGTASLFRAMESLMPEWAWGVIAIVSGAMIIYGVLKPSYRNLTRGAWIAFIHWGLISVFYFMGDWMNTGGLTALTFAVYAAFIYLNIRVNHPDARNKRKGSGSE